MSNFIELTRCGSEARGVTVNADHILTFSTEIETDTFRDVSMRPQKGEVYTEITLAGGSPHAPAKVMVAESYEEVRRLIGLDCPIHGQVGA